ncbi:MAG: hypothetical protein ACTSO9_19770 [Candidatus Helarchaeota archaeon]
MQNKFRKRIITLREFITNIPKYIYFRFIKQTKLKNLNENLAEKIRMEVSEINGCKFCYYGHHIISEYLKSEENDNQIITDLDKLDKNSKEWLALDFARLYLYYINRVKTTDNIKNSLRKLQKKFSRDQIEKIKTIVYIMNFNNRSMNTLEMFIGRITGKIEPVKESSIIGEIILILLLSFIAIPRAIQIGSLKLRTKNRNRK